MQVTECAQGARGQCRVRWPGPHFLPGIPAAEIDAGRILEFGRRVGRGGAVQEQGGRIGGGTRAMQEEVGTAQRERRRRAEDAGEQKAERATRVPERQPARREAR